MPNFEIFERVFGFVSVFISPLLFLSFIIHFFVVKADLYGEIQSESLNLCRPFKLLGLSGCVLVGNSSSDGQAWG